MRGFPKGTRLTPSHACSNISICGRLKSLAAPAQGGFDHRLFARPPDALTYADALPGPIPFSLIVSIEKRDTKWYLVFYGTP